MTAARLDQLDFSMPTQPNPGTDMRRLLTEWLAYQRAHFRRKLRDLSPEGVVTWSIPPVQLSVLGLVRHMANMEHGYLVLGLGGGEWTELYGEDDYAGGSIDTIDIDLAVYEEHVTMADRAIAAMPSLDSTGAGHGWPLGYTLIKMIDEYALHSGQAHMLRYAALGEMIR